LNKEFGKKSTDPFQFAEFLQDQDMQLERRLAQLQNGAPATKRRNKYVLVDKALDRLREQYFAGRIPSVSCNILTQLDTNCTTSNIELCFGQVRLQFDLPFTYVLTWRSYLNETMF